MHALFALFLAVALPVRAENWPEFRGPTGQGTYPGKNLPIEWSTTKNVAWKVDVPGRGWSSPIVQDGRIYLTSAAPSEDSKDLSLQALCFDAASGKQLWQTEVFRQDAKAPKPRQSAVSPIGSRRSTNRPAPPPPSGARFCARDRGRNYG